MKLIPRVSVISPGLAAVLRPSTEAASFSYLRELYFSFWDFDEDWYLSHHEDLRHAIPNRDFLTGREHFGAVGYFEGRLPAFPSVDDDFYLSTYPDVSSAIIDGTFHNAREHFHLLGYAEGRLPSAPAIDVRWYAQRYLRGKARLYASQKDCTEHFMRVGYLNGALPAPPR